MAKEIKFKQLLEVHCNENEKSKTVIQVVRWGKNAPTLEKRNYFMKDDEWLCGKACGFTRKDFKRCLKHKDEILELLTEE